MCPTLCTGQTMASQAEWERQWPSLCSERPLTVYATQSASKAVSCVPRSPDSANRALKTPLPDG